MIAGVTAAGVGSFLSGYFFIYCNEKFLFYFFKKKKEKPPYIDQLSWKGKVLLSYICSDVIKSTIFLPFEARKQRIQMCQSYVPVQFVVQNMTRAFLPFVLKDVLFRIVTLGSFLNFLQVKHQPHLKYDINDIRDYIKSKESNRERILVSDFVDYSKIEIYSPFSMIFFNLIMCNIVATLVTQPLDVIATKILTQTEVRYRGMISAYKMIIKEDGVIKLVYSGFQFRLAFNILSSMSVMILYEKINKLIKDYYEK